MKRVHRDERLAGQIVLPFRVVLHHMDPSCCGIDDCEKLTFVEDCGGRKRRQGCEKVQRKSRCTSQKKAKNGTRDGPRPTELSIAVRDSQYDVFGR